MINSQEALEQRFEQVRRVYFPRWRRSKGWSVREGTPPGGPWFEGYCDLKTRTIWIADRSKGHGLLIHETTHALTGLGHGVRFQRRLLRAADDAEAQDNAALATALRKEVAEYASAPPVRASDVYDEIRDHVWECDDYEKLLPWLAQENGLLLEEFEKQYPRARRVYDQARRRLDQVERQKQAGLVALDSGSAATHPSRVGRRSNRNYRGASDSQSHAPSASGVCPATNGL